MVERVFPQEDGSVERHIYPGDGQPPEIKEYDTDEHYLEEIRREQRHERLQRLMHPLRTIREKVIGALDTSEKVRAEQLTREAGSQTFLQNTVEGWRRSDGGTYHA